MCEISNPVCVATGERNQFSVKLHLTLFKPLDLCSAAAQVSKTHTNIRTHIHKYIYTGARHAHMQQLIHSLSHMHMYTRAHTHSGERKLQHNDKVWEHNGLSSAQTEARTSLAPKGQQASPGFHSVPPVIIVQHYNDYSDGLYFANVGAIRKYQWNMKVSPIRVDILHLT